MAKFNFRIFQVLAMIASALADGKITRDEAKNIILMIIDIFYPVDE